MASDIKMFQQNRIMKLSEIKDSYFVTYGIFYSMGVLTFVPHQFFTVATDYWMYKFRDPSRDMQPDIPRPPRPPNNIDDMKDLGFAHDRTPLQTHFTSSFAITCQMSMLGFLIVTALFSKQLPPPQKRILGALFSMLILFIVNAAFTEIDTDSFQEAFFAITILLAILLNLSSAVTMISLFELVTKFPLGYYGAILSGQAICAIMSSLVQILTLSINSSSVMNGTIYFGVGSLIILSTTIFYIITKRRSKYFIYRIGLYEGTETVSTSSWSFNLYKIKGALQKTKWYMGAMVFVQGSTAVIHPGLTALIVAVDDTDDDSGRLWNDLYFVPVVTFLGFHLSDFIGREVANKFKRPKCAFAILGMVILRLGVVPLLIFCNAQPRRRLPVYFGDNFYIIMILIFGFTQGYLVNLCIISVPTIVRNEELEIATVLLPLLSTITVAICSALNLLIIGLI